MVLASLFSLTLTEYTVEDLNASTRSLLSCGDDIASDDDKDDDDISCSSKENASVSDGEDLDDDFDNEDHNDEEDSVFTTQSQALRRLHQTRMEAEALLQLELIRLGQEDATKSAKLFSLEARSRSTSECLDDPAQSQKDPGALAMPAE